MITLFFFSMAIRRKPIAIRLTASKLEESAGPDVESYPNHEELLSFRLSEAYRVGVVRNCLRKHLLKYWGSLYPTM